MYAIALSLLILAQISPTPTSRTVQQNGADWQYHLTFRNQADTPLILTPSDISAHLTGNLSNPRPGIPGLPAAHAHPARTNHAIAGHLHTSANLLHGSIEDPERCEEKVILAVWPDGPEVMRAFGRQSPLPTVGPPPPPVKFAEPPGDETPIAGVTVEPGGVVNVRLRLIHQHAGNHGIDPLLGRREVTLKLGDMTYKDTIDISHEQYYHLPDIDYRPMAGIPDEHKDTLIFFSPPDCLVLDAAEPGNQYWRAPERKVRGAVRLRLKFKYMIDSGCEGEVKVRIAQYRESPNQWRVLTEGGFERELKKPPLKPTGKRDEVKAGEWLTFEEVFKTESEANVCAIDFRIANADAGIAWVDDVELIYVGVGNGPVTP